MAQRGSKYLLGYTVDSDLVDNELFPNPFLEDKDKYRQSKIDDNLSEFDNISDTNDNIFKRKSLLQDNTYNNEDFDEESDDGGSNSGSKAKDGKGAGAFKTNFDTDSENEIVEDDVTLKSSIINKFTEQDLQGDESNDRFKFLNTYQRLYKQKKNNIQGQPLVTDSEFNNQNDIPLQTMNTNNSSVFNLSQLDDFNRFVKMSELNEKIYSKFEKLNPTGDNLLDVIQSKDLEQNFYMDQRDINKAHDNTSTATVNNSRRWYNIDWKKNNNDNIVKNTELYTESPQISSDSTPPGSSNRYLSRRLKVRHLQMISFGGTLGVGLFLNSGKAITIAGGLGTLLSFIICGAIVLATIVSFCEMVTFVSIVDGVSGLSSRFVDDAFGFAVGWSYFISFAFGLAGEMVASVIMLTYYPNLKILENKGSVAGFVAFFLLTVILSNSINVQFFGEVEYISSFIKLLFILLMIIFMIVLNTGGFGGENLGFKYWDYSQSDFEHNIIFGLFRPTFNLEDNGTNGETQGIGGDKGRFLSLMVAIMVVFFAYSGTEIVCIAACEAKDPRKALPSATKRVFWRIVIFYCLSAFVVSLNLYAGDPRLLRYQTGSTGVAIDDFSTNYAIKYVGGNHCNSKAAVFAGYSSGSQSPWIVALQSANLCHLSSAVNGFLVFFAVSCGNAQLYVSSRTMYSLSLQGKAPQIFSKCNRYGIPYYSVGIASMFGLLAFICVSEEATVVFQNLSTIIASSGIIVWAAMNLSYIRFYFGLKRRPDIISRNDSAYPYKSFLQPYTAIFGLAGSMIIILGMGFTIFLDGYWDTLTFFTCYGTLILFAICYVVYKFVYGTRIPSLDTLDFDSGRREIDRYIWDGNKDYNQRNVKEVLHKFMSFLA